MAEVTNLEETRGLGIDQFSEMLREAEAKARPVAEEPEVVEAAEEPVVAEGADDAEAEAEAELLAGKFKTQEDLVKAYEEATRRLGEQKNEIGELRQQFAQWQEQQQPQASAPLAMDQGTYEQIVEAVDQNPQATLDYILQNAPQYYDAAMEHWGLLDPFAAARYDNRVQAALVQSQIASQVQPTVDRYQSEQNLAVVETAARNVLTKHQDFGDYAEEIAKIGPLYPGLDNVLRTGNQAEKEAALESLYFMAKGMRGQAVATASENLQTQQASTIDREKSQVSALTSGSTAKNRSEGDRLAAFHKSILDAGQINVASALQQN